MVPDHEIPIHVADDLQGRTTETSAGVPANIYRTANYLVIDVGLPRCLAAQVRVTMAPGALLVEAERHPGDLSTEQGRDYALHELSSGTVRRHFHLPAVGLALDAASAHFANGMLTISIPSPERADYRCEVRAGHDAVDA